MISCSCKYFVLKWLITSQIISPLNNQNNLIKKVSLISDFGVFVDCDSINLQNTYHHADNLTARLKWSNKSDVRLRTISVFALYSLIKNVPFIKNTLLKMYSRFFMHIGWSANWFSWEQCKDAWEKNTTHKQSLMSQGPRAWL